MFSSIDRAMTPLAAVQILEGPQQVIGRLCGPECVLKTFKDKLNGLVDLELVFVALVFFDCFLGADFLRLIHFVRLSLQLPIIYLKCWQASLEASSAVFFQMMYTFNASSFRWLYICVFVQDGIHWGFSHWIHLIGTRATDLQTQITDSLQFSFKNNL